MARIRTIKPEFWTDGKIVQLPFHVRLIFIGLWNFCDDDGFLIEEHDRLQMQIMPGDDVNVEACIDLLVACELLSRHTLNDGSTAIQINHFTEHQKISHPTASKIIPEISGKVAIRSEDRRKVAVKYGCEPGGNKSVQCYSCGMSGDIWWPKTQKGKPSYWVAFSGLELSHFVAESNGGENTSENIVLCCRACNRSMHQDTPVSKALQMIPELSGGLTLEGKGRDSNGEEGKGSNMSAARGRSNSDFEEEFEQFWKSFPKQRRTKKQEAYRKWKLAIKRVDAETLTTKAAEYAASEVGRGQYAVMPSVWLNGGCWEDDKTAWGEPQQVENKSSKRKFMSKYWWKLAGGFSGNITEERMNELIAAFPKDPEDYPEEFPQFFPKDSNG